jgi:hypothetical protein
MTPYKPDGLVQRLKVLSEYEFGRAQIAIEWVARGHKPIVELGGRLVDGPTLRWLVDDLNLCVAESGEQVRGFVVPEKPRGFCCYGFYRYPWAIEALMDMWRVTPRGMNVARQIWQEGLIFGYSPEAIQRFIWSAFGGPASKWRSSPCIPSCRRRRVEIYGSLVSLVRLRNSRNDRSRMSD